MNPGFSGGMPAGNANANANAGMARIQQFVFQNLRQQQVPPGWQQTFTAQQRTMTILQFVTNARLANQNSSVDDIVRSSINFETERFVRSPTKEHYINTMRQRLDQFKQVRERNAQQLQRPGGMPQNMGGMQMMQNGMGNMMQGGQMPQGVPFQMGQMQPNSMPMQPSNSMGGDANMTNGFHPQRTPQQQPQQPQQQQPQQQQQQQPQPQPQPGAQMGNMPQNFDMARINMFAQKLAASASQQQREMANAQINALTMHQRQELQAKGVEPHIWFWRQQAIKLLQSRQKNAANQNQMNQQAGPGMMMPGGNQEMQSQQMTNQASQSGMPGGPNYDFSTFAEQQQGAMRSQDLGHDVVPASNNMGQPGMGPLNGMQQNQQGMGAQTPNMAQRQQPGMTPQQMAQRQQSLQAQAHARAQAAQNQSPAQQFQMRPQGGLNMAPNQGGSPALSMLNRPMPPPVQAPNGTPQPPRPPSGPPNGTPQPGMAGQLQGQQNQPGQQMHQAPTGTPNQAHPPGLPQGFPPHMPDHLKQQLMRHPEGNRSAILQNWLRQHPVPSNLAAQAGAQFAMGGQPGQALNQQNNQAKQGNPLLNSANPDFQQFMRQNQGQPGQAPTNQQALLFQQQMRQRQLMNQQNQAPIPPPILRQLDERQYPPQIIQQHIRANLPQDIRTWGQLKTWSSTNPTLAFDLTPEKIVAMQRMQLNELANRRNQQGNPMGQMGQMQGNRPGAPTHGQPNGQPAQGQMAGMTPGMGQRMNGMPMMPGMPQIPQPTAQDIQNIRSSRPGLANMSDDRIREQIMMHRANLIRQQQQGQQQGQPQGHTGVPQFPGAPQPRPGGQIPPQAIMNQPGNMQLNQQRQQPGTQPQQQPQAQPNAQPVRAPQPNKTQQSNQTPAATPRTQPAKKVKRSHEEFQEAPKAPQPSPRNETAQNGQPQNQQASNFTPEQLQKMPAAQRNKILAQQSQNAIRNQDQNKSAAPEDKEATASLQPKLSQEKAGQLAKQYYQELQMTLPNNPQPVDANQRKEMAVKVRHAMSWLPKIGPALMHCLSYDNNEEKVKQTIRAHLLIQRNINKQASDLNQTLTITPETLDASINKLNAFLTETTRMMRTRAAAQQAQSQGAGGSQLNAQNLQNLQQQTAQLRQQQQQQQHRRTSSQQRSQVPSAPTSSKPPMQLGSPHGVPTYAPSTPKMDPNNLHIPPSKKQKVGSKLATEPKAGKETGGSPKTAKTSPQKRQQAEAAAKAAAKPQPAFTCPQQSCDFSITGFKTKKELDEHQQKFHQTPEDVLGFVVDGVADSLGLNQDGTSKMPKPEPVAANRGVKMAPSQRPQSLQTKTGIKQEVSTPASAAMGRVPTQTGAKSSPSANALKTPQATIKTQTPTSGAQMGRTPSKAPKENAAEKPAEPAPTMTGEPELPNNAWAGSDISPQTLDQLMDGLIDDLNLPPVTLSNAFDLTNATAASLGLPDESWAGPRSTTPATTPSSSKTESRESDIGENDNLKIDLQWDAARWADTSDMLPVDASLAVDLQGLGVSLGMDPNIANQSMDDLMMAGLDVDASKADWNWDTLFGEKAGLENDLKDGFPVADTNQLDSLFAV